MTKIKDGFFKFSMHSFRAVFHSFFLLLVITLLSTYSLHSQVSLCGKVLVNNQPEMDVTVTAKNRKDTVQLVYRLKTDDEGNFCFSNLAKGTYSISANWHSTLSENQIVQLHESKHQLTLKIHSVVELEELIVESKSQQEIKESHSIKTEVVDLEKNRLASTSTETLMNNTAGVRVRNSSGIGGEADIIVSGFSGKSVKVLIDGIPIDYLGASMGITKIPTSIASHIEVYKGVLPTEIGVDALGGAINIVTKNPSQSKHQFSYQIGSFNSHQLTINSFNRISEKFSFRVNVFGVHSDNNYKVDQLPIENETTGKTEYITARLFHNRYQQLSGDVQINFEKRKWADLFRITVNSFGLNRQLQNDFASRNRPYGAAQMKEHAYAVPSILYKKNFLENKLSLSQFVVFSAINNQLMDTLRNGYYDWLGQKHTNVSGSETGTDFSNLKEPIVRATTSNVTYRGLVSYFITPKHKLILNVINSFLHRNADDLSQLDSKKQIAYNRFIAGLGYQFYLLDSKLEGVTQVKALLSNSTSRTISPTSIQSDSMVQNLGFSFAQSIKYQSSKGWLFRASAENTYRLPDQLEIFGDNVFIIPNLNLKPERSINVNVGVGYRYKKYVQLEVSGYFRNVKDMIRLKEITQFQAHYLNLDHVRGYGIELDATFEPIERLVINGNLTYNEFRFRGSNNQLLQNNHFINARVSNMPFYFGNASISYQFKRLFTTKDNLKIFWNYNYVHQFYLDFIEKQYEPDGFLGLYGKSNIYTNRVIPIQHVHSAGVVWQIELPKTHVLAVSATLNNMFDAAIYNNFKLQSPGRNFSIKLSYEL